MELNNKSTCSFVVSNPGKFSLDVGYDLSGPLVLQPHLQVEPKLDTVAVSFTPQVLFHGGFMEILFSLYPHKAVRYHEKVVSEMCQTSGGLEILGQVVEMKINLESSAHEVVNSGAVQIGQQSLKLIPLVNCSHASLTCSLRRH